MERSRFKAVSIYTFAFIAWAFGTALSPGTALGAITTVAGDSTAGFSGDGGPATGASLNRPSAVFVDGEGDLYIADTNNHRIRKVASDTMITITGNGTEGFSGDGGPAVSASLNTPHGIFVDGEGNLYIADTRNHRVRKVSSSGTITTIAGNGTEGFSGDGGPAASASLNRPHGVFVDGEGVLYIADTNNHRIRKVVSDTISTVAGNGARGFSGDGGPATQASLNGPVDIVADSTGALYISDRSNNRVRMVVSDTITTVAGSGADGFSGDGGPATSASLSGPRGISLDGEGNLYIVDRKNHRIRKVASDTITTIAGNGARGFSGDGGPAADASLNFPRDVFADGADTLYIADRENHRIRKVVPGDEPSTPDAPSDEPPTPPAPSPDFNGDGKVDFQDFVQFAQRFGAEEGETNYDAGFDLDSDGRIAFSDFVLFARAFGR